MRSDMIVMGLGREELGFVGFSPLWVEWGSGRYLCGSRDGFGVIRTRSGSRREASIGLVTARGDYGEVGESGSSGSPSRRQNRVAELVKRELGEIVADAGRTWFGGATLVSLTGVEMSPDLQQATVWVSVITGSGGRGGTDLEGILTRLKKERKTIRYRLAQRLRTMRTVPELLFRKSETEGIFRTMGILDKLSAERQAREGEEQVDQGRENKESNSSRSDLDSTV